MMKKLMLLPSAICFACMVIKAEYVNSFTDSAGVTWKLAAPSGWSGGIFDPLSGSWKTPPYPSSAIITGANVPSAEAEHLVIPQRAIWATHGDGIYDISGSPLVTVIRYSAFQNYDALKAVSIPYTVTTIGTPCFKGCSNLSAIKITNGGNKYTELEVAEGSALHSFSSYITVDGVLYNKDKTELLKYPEGKEGDFFAVPASVTKLAPYCFANTKLKAVQFLGDCPKLDSDSTIFSGSSCIVYRYSEANGWKDGAYWADGTSWGGSYVYDFPRSGRREEEGKAVNYEIGNGCLYRYEVENGEATILSVPRRICGEVSIPSVLSGCPVTSIGYNAFGNCHGLTSVTIPDGVTNIATYVFHGCSNLTVANLPDSVRHIGQGAFQYCALEKMRIPVALENIGEYPFAHCRFSMFEVPNANGRFKGINGLLCSKDGKTVVMCAPSVQKVIVPDGITAIRNEAFTYCSTLEEVKLPPSLEVIGGWAFYGCSALKNIAIPDSVTYIGQFAFSYCTDLTAFAVSSSNERYKSDFGLLLSKYGNELLAVPGGLAGSLAIPDGIEFIRCGAFCGCSGLTHVVIPDSVTSIEDWAFSGCSDTLFDTTAIPGVKLVDGWALGNTGSLSGNLNLIDVRGIGEGAFNGCSGLTSVTIPDSVTSIDAGAFRNCSNITSVTVGKGVTSIEGNAFSGCTGLTSVNISDIFAWCNIWFGYEANPLFYAHNLYTNGVLITDLMIPDGVTQVGDRAFEGCSSLVKVTIPNSVTSIGYCAFSGCNDALFDMTTIPGVKLVDSWAVGNTGSLSGDLNLTGVRGIGDGAFGGCEGLTGVTIPNSVTSIGDDAFSWCEGLTSVMIGSGVKRIGEFTFSGCYNLTGIVLPDSVEYVGDEAFSYCEELIRIVFGKGLTEIDEGAFSGCTALKAMVFTGDAPSVIDSYYDDGFVDINPECVIYVRKDSVNWGVEIPGTWNGLRIEYLEEEPESLVEFTIENGVLTAVELNGATEVTIPDGVTSIGEGAFASCEGLTSVTIPDGVTSIGRMAFTDCSGLSSVMISDGVASIGDWAFFGCIGLADVTIPASVTSIGSGAFADCTALRSFNIAPENSSYKTASDLLMTKDGTTVVAVLGGRTSVTIPDGVTNIGGGVFYGCSDLTSVTISDGVASIGDMAFHGCSGLIHVTMPDSVTNIGYYAFSDCSGIASMTIPDGVTGLEDGIFFCCGSLTSVAIPASVTSIGNLAFYGCIGLTNINVAPGDIDRIKELMTSSGFDINGVSYVENGMVRVVFDANGGTGGKTVTQNYGTTLTAPTVTRTGYTFAGWSPAVPSTMPAANATYVAQWTKNKYTVTFNANGGTGGWSRSMDYGAAIAAPAVTRTGYTFAGWSPAVARTVPIGGVSYTAQWTINRHKVTLSLNGGEGVGSVTVNYGTKVGDLPVPFREGYEFLGWFTAAKGGRRVADSELVTGDMMLYAQWHILMPELYDETEAIAGEVPATAASEYNGCLVDAKGNVVGSIQVKVGKSNAKTGLASVKATVQLGAKKVTLKAAGKGSVQIAADGPTAIGLVGGEPCTVVLGSDGISGFYGGHDIDGSRNFFASKDKGEQNAANAVLGKWLGGVSILADAGNFTVTISAKGKAKVSGTLANGTKATGNAVFLVGEEWACVPVVLPKANISFALWLPLDGGEVVVNGLGDDVVAGRGGALKSGAAFRIDEDEFAAVTGIAALPYLPDGVSVEPKGMKWAVAGGTKAGKVAYRRGTQEVDEAKLGDNPSGLKLTYKKTDGSFKGSFKVYAEVKGKLKATTVSVSGIVLNGVGYGTATVKGKGSVPVTIE